MAHWHDDEPCDLTDKECEAQSTVAKQNIWRTVSVPDHNGVFVWEILEFVPYNGVTKPASKQFIELRDGTYIDIWCNHFFTAEKAEKLLNEQDMTKYGAIYHTI